MNDHRPLSSVFAANPASRFDIRSWVQTFGPSGLLVMISALFQAPSKSRREAILFNSDFSRRRMLLQLLGVTALPNAISDTSVPELLMAGQDTAKTTGIPKIALEISRGGTQSATRMVDDAAMRRVKQLGVNDV